MANTLTNIITDLWSVGKEVAQEPWAAINAINMNFDNKGASLLDNIDITVHPSTSSVPYTPSMQPTAGADTVAGKVQVKLTNSSMVTRNLTAEEQRSLENVGTAPEWSKQWIAQAMRTLRNEIEAAVCSTAALGASRVVGTPGTTPFASDMNLFVDARKELRQNGSPHVMANAVIDSAAAANLMKTNIYQQAQIAGSDAERRTGTFKPQFGFGISDSAQIVSKAAGTGSAYVLNGAHAKGATSITVKTGSGTVLAGDIVTIGAYKYVALTAISAPGTFTIAAPGLMSSGADGATVTVNTTAFTPNFACEKSAIVGIVRPPLMNENPIIQKVTITDPSGLPFLLCQVEGDGMTTWRLHAAYGFRVLNPEFLMLVAG